MVDSNFNAAILRLVEAKKLAMVRKLEIEAAREHAEIKWRAEYEPVVRNVALGVAHDVALGAAFLITGANSLTNHRSQRAES